MEDDDRDYEDEVYPNEGASEIEMDEFASQGEDRYLDYMGWGRGDG